MNETAGIKTGSENSKVVFPDYRNSIVNLSNSIMDSFGVDPLHTVLKQLPKSTISAKNVVLLVLDGLGMELLNSLEPGIVPFLKESVVGNLSSVYPSTTTAALTSLLTGMTPIEHGALGWSLFFKEFRRFVDFLPLADSDSHEFLDSRRYPLHEMMGFKTIFERIGERDISVEQFFLVESWISKSSFTRETTKSASVLPYETPEEMFDLLGDLLERPGNGRRFAFCYSTKPDSYEHRLGTRSEQVKNFLERFDRLLGDFCARFSGSDTTLILTSDHGLVDMERYDNVYENRSLFESLVLPTQPEPRFVNFFVKNHKREQFFRQFRLLDGEFMLFDRSNFLEKGFLGSGTAHPRVDDFIGDFVAIARKNVGIVTESPAANRKFPMGMHGGLTREEMLVPLVARVL